MKKVFLFSALIVQTIASAQDTITEQSALLDFNSIEDHQACSNVVLKPEKGFVGLSMNIKGILSSVNVAMPADQGQDFLMMRYYTSDLCAWRVGLGTQIHSFKRNSLDSVGTALVQIDSVSKQAGFYLSLGHEWHFNGNEHLDPYVGGILAFAKMGRNTINYSLNQKDTIGESNFSIISDLPGSSLFRAGFIAGFNYFIRSDISLGAEFMLSYNYQTSGGDYSVVTIDKPVSGSETVTREVGTRLTKQGSFGFMPLANITFSYFFRPSNQ